MPAIGQVSRVFGIWLDPNQPAESRAVTAHEPHRALELPVLPEGLPGSPVVFHAVVLDHPVFPSEAHQVELAHPHDRGIGGIDLLVPAFVIALEPRLRIQLHLPPKLGRDAFQRRVLALQVFPNGGEARGDLDLSSGGLLLAFLGL